MEHKKKKSFTRRTFIFGGVQAGLGTLILGRLYYLQMIAGKEYLTLAEENRISFRFIMPRRGTILDRFGEPLATSKKIFRLVVVPENIKNIQNSLDAIKKIIPKPDISWEDIAKQIKKKPKFYPTIIKENLDWKEVSRIELSLTHSPGVFVEESWKRYYPFPASTSHILGYTGMPSEKFIRKKNLPYFKHPDARMGKSGIEKIYDEKIQGIPGSKNIEVNARGRIVRELKRNPPISGNKIYTTLDVRLQEKIKDLLKPYKSGAVVVLDIQTGAVRALVSTPSFDSNSFTLGIDKALWKTLTTNEYGPLFNKAIQGQYAPASTFKMVTALAALLFGIITPKTTVYCPGYIYIGKRKFHCWRKHGHGTVDLDKAIKKSCDVYFYEIGKKLDIDQLAEVAQSLGFGSKTGIDLPEESGALMPTREWKKRVKNKSWYPGESIISAIGQGYILATPLQLAVMTARLASGKTVTPYIVKPTLTKLEDIKNLDPYYLKLIQESMSNAVNTPEGTSWKHRLPWENWKMAGKTGTAQVRRITLEERRMGIFKNNVLPWKYRDNALFVGFAPVHNPRFAISVVVEHTGFGGTYAAPIAKEIMKYLKENGA